MLNSCCKRIQSHICKNIPPCLSAALLLFTVPCTVQRYYTRLLTSQRAFTWRDGAVLMLWRGYLIAWPPPPPPAPDMSSIIQIKCHKLDAAERLTDSLIVTVSIRHRISQFLLSTFPQIHHEADHEARKTHRELSLFLCDSFSTILSPLITS